MLLPPEYENYYFIIHRAFSQFLGNINNINERLIFDYDKLDKIKQLLNKVKDIKKSEKDALINIFETLVDTDNNNIFVEKSIMYYPVESKFYYLFNMMMRSFVPGLAHFAFYMGHYYSVK